jgi:hypothetical protein
MVFTKQSIEAQAYAIIYLIIFFILILNFVLAIIVDAYMNVRRVVSSPNPLVLHVIKHAPELSIELEELPIELDITPPSKTDVFSDIPCFVVYYWNNSSGMRCRSQKSSMSRLVTLCFFSISRRICILRLFPLSLYSFLYSLAVQLKVTNFLVQSPQACLNKTFASQACLNNTFARVA